MKILSSKKTTTLLDAGGWYMLAFLFGISFFGIVIDYFLNFLVLHFSLRRLRYHVSLKRKFVYTIIATLFGFIIDWLYYELTWGNLVLGIIRIPPYFSHAGEQPFIETTTILIPMVFLFFVNYLISHLLLHVSSKQSVIIGAAMGLFTAPWIIVVFTVFRL